MGSFVGKADVRLQSTSLESLFFGGMWRHWVVFKGFCVFFPEEMAMMCLSGGLYEWRLGLLYLSHEYFCLRAERPQHRKHIRQASPKSHPPSLPLSLWFLASFTPSLSVCLLSWELYIQAVMLLGLLPEPPWHTPLKTPKVIEMQHFLSSLRGWPLTLAQNRLFSTLMHPCF